MQSNGKVVIGGYFTSVNGTAINYLARLNSDGSLDTSFGNGQAGVNGTVYAMALQSDGKLIVAGGFYAVNGTSHNGIARLNNDGTLDTAFGNGLAGASGTVSSVALQVIGGYFATVNGVARSFLVRLWGFVPAVNADLSTFSSLFPAGIGMDCA